MTGKRMLIDTSKCIGCKACQVACQQWHSLPAADTAFTGSYTNPPDMSGANLTVAKFNEVEVGGKLKWLFFKDQCRHCEYPFCLDACPLGAIRKNKKKGMILINPDICNPSACKLPYTDLRPCQLYCPYKSVAGMGVPRWKYVKDGELQGEKMRKCDFCYDRFPNTDLKKGEFANSRKPACEVTCTPGAIKSGKADTILKKAKSRVRYLKRHGYPNANIYPLGGDHTHVVWVLAEDPKAYGL
jgi:formate dehydrogenase iron-sulfur subunit